MLERARTKAASGPATAPKGRLAVVDIGSNSVRLVVFAGLSRTPEPLFNEKVQCGLGNRLGSTGRLDPQGIKLALDCLGRFARLADYMGVERIDLLATAAVRDAEDGPAFVAEVEKRLGLTVTILSGAEEARLAALGVACGQPQADGLMADLGGGSLDLVMLDRGRFGPYASLPLGVLRLHEAVDGNVRKAAEHVDKLLGDLPWLADVQNRTFFPVGGAWRSLARIFIDQTGYPLHVLDHYTLTRREAMGMVDVISRLGRSSLDKIRTVSRRRLATLPIAATLMERLLVRARPARLVFSVYGMREGFLFRQLPEAVRARDPLVDACEQVARREGRFGVDGQELLRWAQPLFLGEGEAEKRLRLAAGLLSDVAWRDHPDYRAKLTFDRVLHMQLPGLDHRDRVFLALATYVRYNGDPDEPHVDRVRALLDEESQVRALVTGLALRLAYTLSAGVPGLLVRSALRRGGDRLTLVVPRDDEVFDGETVERRFQTLARVMGLKPLIGREKR